MVRLLLFVVVAGFIFAAGAGFGMRWVARIGAARAEPSHHELALRERMAVIDHHTELLERSRRASLDGEPGLANIYREAAERVLRLTGDADDAADDGAEA